MAEAEISLECILMPDIIFFIPRNSASFFFLSSISPQHFRAFFFFLDCIAILMIDLLILSFVSFLNLFLLINFFPLLCALLLFYDFRLDSWCGFNARRYGIFVFF